MSANAVAFENVEDIKSAGAELQLRDALRMHIWAIRDLADKAKIDDYRTFLDRMDEIRLRIDDAITIYEATTFPHNALKTTETILP